MEEISKQSMVNAFTDAFMSNYTIDSTKSGADYVREKGERPGFAFRVTLKGTKTFVYIYTNQTGKRKYLHLGKYPYVSLKQAREGYDEAYQLKVNGIDPIDHYKEIFEQEQKEKERLEQLGTVKDLFDFYHLRLIEDGKSSAGEVRRSLYRDALDMIGRNKLANEVTPTDISIVINKVFNRGAETLSNRLWSYLHAAFEFGFKYDYSSRRIRGNNKRFEINYNPVKKVEKPLEKEKKGTRHLSEAELLKFWDSLHKSPISLQMEYILKLLILTSGQRVKEVVECPWSEININDKLWVLPEDRAKNDRQHYIILSEPTIDLLNKIQSFNETSNCDDSIYLFPSPQYKKLGDKPIRFDAITKAVRRVCEYAEIEHFSPRDLRRTAKTLMGKAGIRNDLRYRIQNHALVGVSKNYDFYDNEVEFRDAMDKWTSYLEKVVGLQLFSK